MPCENGGVQCRRARLSRDPQASSEMKLQTGNGSCCWRGWVRFPLTQVSSSFPCARAESFPVHLSCQLWGFHLCSRSAAICSHWQMASHTSGLTLARMPLSPGSTRPSDHVWPNLLWDAHSVLGFWACPLIICVYICAFKKDVYYILSRMSRLWF